MYGGVFAIEDFAASVGFAFGTYPRIKVNPVHIKKIATSKNFLTFHWAIEIRLARQVGGEII